MEQPDLDEEDHSITPCLQDLLSEKNAPYRTFKQNNLKFSTILLC